MGISNIGGKEDFSINNPIANRQHFEMAKANLRNPENSNQPIQKEEVMPDELDKVTKIIEDRLKKLSKIFKGEAKFEIERELDIIIVKIIDKDSKEIIRQIPPEVSVKLAKALNDVQGILLDEIA
ncbi:flagellar protein FlaG [Petrotoga miotherma DSM 10691]|uniref:Flagellar protein FlaG n=1 Tax=Petrotoga miotherma DSM 10691 TaxID=1434326 RepID=A0A2K1PCK6_9BACT|nr:flagellar protein FlaG [Petrotoga miotherma]PNS00524.1 flagellar protein FlaG [Petrotoga miotherma DSM 10691]